MNPHIFKNRSRLCLRFHRPVKYNKMFFVKIDRLRGLNKHILIPVLIVCFIAAIFALCYKPPLQMVFSEDGMVVGDGRGPYTDRYEGVHIGMFRDRGFVLNTVESSRSVFVKFGEASWKNERLWDTYPVLPTGEYRVLLAVFLPESFQKTLSEIEVGESAPVNVFIRLHDPDTGDFLGALQRFPGDFRIGNRTFKGPEPPKSLFDEGHLTIIRTGEHSWLVDVDAWFVIFQPSPTGELTKHYVRLSFKLKFSA